MFVFVSIYPGKPFALFDPHPMWHHSEGRRIAHFDPRGERKVSSVPEVAVFDAAAGDVILRFESDWSARRAGGTGLVLFGSFEL